MALLAEAEQTVPTTDTVPGEEEPQPDHLADIHTFMGGETRVRTQIVLRRLAELNPAEYDDWTFRDLAAALADYAIRPAKHQEKGRPRW